MVLTRDLFLWLSSLLPQASATVILFCSTIIFSFIQSSLMLIYIYINLIFTLLSSWNPPNINVFISPSPSKPSIFSSSAFIWVIFAALSLTTSLNLSHSLRSDFLFILLFPVYPQSLFSCLYRGNKHKVDLNWEWAKHRSKQLSSG